MLWKLSFIFVLVQNFAAIADATLRKDKAEIMGAPAAFIFECDAEDPPVQGFLTGVQPLNGATVGAEQNGIFKKYSFTNLKRCNIDNLTSGACPQVSADLKKYGIKPTDAEIVSVTVPTDAKIYKTPGRGLSFGETLKACRSFPPKEDPFRKSAGDSSSVEANTSGAK